MPVNLTFSVMTHPSRMKNALHVAGSQPGLGMEIVVDPVPDGKPGAVRTAQRAWESMPETSTHHAVLQDDIQATADLGRHLADVVAQVPEAPLCLFTEWASKTAQAARLTALEGYGLVEVIDHLHTTQGVVLPAGIVRGFTGYLRGSGIAVEDAVADADLLFGYLRTQKHTVYMTLPNLVEHIEVPSLLANDVLRGPRRSPCFDAQLPPREWKVQPADRAAVVPHMSTDGRSYCHLRSGAGWTSEHTLSWMTSRGATQKALADTFLAEMAALPEGPAVRAALSDALVFQLWLTAVASGHVLRELRGFGTGRLDAALADPGADLAWSTLVPGALRKTVPLEAGRKLGVALRPLLDRALLRPPGTAP